MGAHVEISERMAQLIQHGQLVFYDHSWLGGWPVFQFNGFLAHLITAVVSIPLDYFHNDPVQLASQLLVYFGLVLLPFSLFYASTCLTGHTQSRPLAYSAVLAMFCGSVSVWFLLHSVPEAHVGADTIVIEGDYPQLFAWHLLLLNFGFLARAITAPSSQYHKPKVAFGLVFLALTQPTSAVLLAFYAAFAVFFFNRVRRQLVFSYALALGMLAFWIVPSFFLIDEYTVARATVSNSHLIDLLLGVSHLGQGVSTQAHSSILPQWLPFWDYGALILLTLTGIWIVFFRTTDHGALLPFLVFSGMLSGLFLSFYFTNLIPFALDYQLLSSLVLVILLPIISAFPAELLKIVNHHWIAAMAAVTLATAICAQKIALQTPPFHPQAVSQQDADELQDEAQIINYFRRTSTNGRVFIEWPSEALPTSSRGQLYLESELPVQAGLESASGRFFSNSPPYVCAVVPAVSALNAATNPDFLHNYAGRCYDGNPPLNSRPTRSEQEYLQLLANLGVSHFIAVSEDFANALLKAGAELKIRVNSYQVLAAPGSFSPLQYPAFEPIGYFDFTGNLPTRYVSQSLFSNTDLSSSITLIQMQRGRRVPAQLSRIIINGAPDENDALGQDLLRAMQEREVLPLNFGENPLTGEIQRGSSRKYAPAHAYLREHLHSHAQFFTPRLLAKRPPPTLDWEDDGQSFTANGVLANQLLEVKYGYHPYWYSTHAWFYKSGNGQMFMESDQSDIRAAFTNTTDVPSQAGMVLSIFSFITLVYTVGLRYRWRPPKPSGR